MWQWPRQWCAWTYGKRAPKSDMLPVTCSKVRKGLSVSCASVSVLTFNCLLPLHPSEPPFEKIKDKTNKYILRWQAYTKTRGWKIKPEVDGERERSRRREGIVNRCRVRRSVARKQGHIRLSAWIPAHSMITSQHSAVTSSLIFTAQTSDHVIYLLHKS